MLRFDQLLAGASWVDEYGSPHVPAERAWLEHMSPYQNLRKRSNFPTPFFVTSTKDDRVHPGHARKYAARMEELGMPFFYYENIDGGHSAAANLNETGRRRALEFTYLMQRLMD
jgi:prolyl oligopeptidase